MVRKGKLDEALSLPGIALRREVAEVGEDHVRVEATQYEIAKLLREQKLDQALSLKVVEQSMAALLVEDHVDVAAPQCEMATGLLEQGKPDEALAPPEAVVRKKAVARKEDHADVGKRKRDIAVVLQEGGCSYLPGKGWGGLTETLLVDVTASGGPHGIVC